MNSIEGSSTIFIEGKRSVQRGSTTPPREETFGQAILRTGKSCFLAIAITVMILFYSLLGVLLADRLGAPLPDGVQSLISKLEWGAWMTAKEAEFQTGTWRVIN